MGLDKMLAHVTHIHGQEVVVILSYAISHALGIDLYMAELDYSCVIIDANKILGTSYPLNWGGMYKLSRMLFGPDFNDHARDLAGYFVKHGKVAREYRIILDDSVMYLGQENKINYTGGCISCDNGKTTVKHWFNIDEPDVMNYAKRFIARV